MHQALFWDDKEKFLSLIHREEGHFRLRGQELLMDACAFVSLNCAAALVNRETPVIVDINLPTPGGMFELHHAAETRWSSITELILCHGDRTDVRCKSDHPIYRTYNNKLPLHLHLRRLRHCEFLKEWTPKQSIFKLLTLFCLPKMQNYLETIGLLAWTTEETEKEFLQYARDGKLKELAALLTVAHRKLTIPMLTVRNSLSSLYDHAWIDEDKKKALSLLLEVFEGAGNAIEAYVEQEKIGVTIEQTSEEVACLLQGAGFALKRSDTDLSDYNWFRDEQCLEKHGFGRECRREQMDIGMAHYGKSGHRWMACSKPSEAFRVFDNKVKKTCCEFWRSSFFEFIDKRSDTYVLYSFKIIVGVFIEQKRERKANINCDVLYFLCRYETGRLDVCAVVFWSLHTYMLDLKLTLCFCLILFYEPKPVASVPNEPWKPIPKEKEKGLSKSSTEEEEEEEEEEEDAWKSKLFVTPPILHRQVPGAISCFRSQTRMKVKAKDKVSGGAWLNAPCNVSTRKPWASLPSAMRVFACHL